MESGPVSGQVEFRVRSLCLSFQFRMRGCRGRYNLLLNREFSRIIDLFFQRTDLLNIKLSTSETICLCIPFAILPFSINSCTSYPTFLNQSRSWIKCFLFEFYSSSLVSLCSSRDYLAFSFTLFTTVLLYFFPNSQSIWDVPPPPHPTYDAMPSLIP